MTGGAALTEDLPRGRQTFRPTDRLKRRPDFRRVQGSGRKIHTPHFVLAVSARQDDGPTRLGITVTRKVASAPGRNRIKRVMREVFRLHRELFPQHCDVVVIAKDGADALGFAEVLAEISGARRGQGRGRPPDRSPGRSPERQRKGPT